MKKLMYLTVMALSLVSCIKKTEVVGTGCTCSNTERNIDPYANEYDVYSEDWTLVGNYEEDGSFWYVDLKCTQLTKTVFDYGNVEVSLFEEDSNRGWIIRTLPVVQPMYGEDNTTHEVVYWTNVWDYDISEGKVRIYLTPSDFKTGSTTPPDAITFRVLIEWWNQ